MVYTPTKGTTAGGHFYSYETMHLTDLALTYDHSKDRDGTIRSQFATNASHPSMPRLIARMMLAVPVIQKERGRSQFVMLYFTFAFALTEVIRIPKATTICTDEYH